jgi:hypothetical protein
MRRRAQGPRPRPTHGLAPWVGGVGVVLVAVLLVATGSPAASASWGSGQSGPTSWTNGLVLCQFAAMSPSVGVSALSLNGTGVVLSVLSVSELRPDGSVAASANLSWAQWNVSNLSSEDAFELSYSFEAPLVGPTGAPLPGSAGLTVSFLLPAYQGSPAGATDTVAAVVSVMNWAWQSSSDHLAMVFATAPSFPAAEHLRTSSSTGWLVDGVSNRTGSPLEQVGASSTAAAVETSGATATVVANASVPVATPAWAEVAVSFGTSAGAFRAITYESHIAIVLPATVAGVPLSELAAAGVGALLVSLLVAAGARRVRQRPSKLIYVTEEEDP